MGCPLLNNLYLLDSTIAQLLNLLILSNLIHPYFMNTPQDQGKIKPYLPGLILATRMCWQIKCSLLVKSILHLPVIAFPIILFIFRGINTNKRIAYYHLYNSLKKPRLKSRQLNLIFLLLILPSVFELGIETITPLVLNPCSLLNSKPILTSTMVSSF